MMDFLYRLQALVRNPWLYVVLLALLIGLLLWVLLGRTFRREPPGIFWETFSDEWGHLDGKLMGVCWIVCLMSLLVFVAVCDPKRYFPEYFVALAGIAGGGLLAVGVGTFSYNRARGGRGKFVDEDGADYEENIAKKVEAAAETDSSTSTESA